MYVQLLRLFEIIGATLDERHLTPWAGGGCVAAGPASETSDQPQLVICHYQNNPRIQKAE